MAHARCPYCRAGQEIEKPAAGTVGRHVCSSCGKPFAFRPTAVSPGSTRKLSPSLDDSPAQDSPSATASPAVLPARMGPYEVRGILGTGGMGVVYQGWDASLGRHVALKTLKPELARDAEFRERFLREARAAAALSHPNVTQIYFIGEEGGQPFFAMEYLEGKSLEALLREKAKLPLDRAVDLVRQAALGLRAAASRGIIHRDIKPSNLVLASDGTLKVTDFGLAKLAVADGGLTLAGEVLGSPDYMSPEQASGRIADLRSDIYSLGATLYELVTGRPPFDGPTAVSIILKHAREPLKNPRQIRPDLPYPLVNLIQKMMAKRPEDRPQSYDLLLRDLDRLIEWPGAGSGRLLAAPAEPALPTHGAPHTPDSSAPSSPVAWILVFVLVLVLLGGWGFLRQLRASASREAPATSNSATSPNGPAPRDTEILATTSEVDPPLPGRHPAGQGAQKLPPRLERLREAARASLQFVTNTHQITEDGRLRIQGSVVNTGLGSATNIHVRISLSRPSGEVLDSAEVPLVPDLLAPRQTGAFEWFFTDPHESISILTELNWNS